MRWSARALNSVAESALTPANDTEGSRDDL